MAQPDDDMPDALKRGESTAPSAEGGADQRAAPRFMLMIRAAKLIVDETSEFLCVIRDASTSGLKIRLFNPLPRHRSLAVELSNGDRYPVEHVWTDGHFAGFRFGSEVDIERLLDETHGAFPKRHVRLRIRLDAILHSGGEAVRIAFHDISQQGACIDSDKWLLMNELVRLETDVLPPIYAKVRWRSHPRYGLLFEQTFKLDELARIAGPLQTGDHAHDALNHPDRLRRS
ncbi:MAG: PilZ domain-containing protein [Novosphingobium sp.]|nr:PilZ domain-containing protein [Novosphingobium sp.]